MEGGVSSIGVSASCQSFPRWENLQDGGVRAFGFHANIKDKLLVVLVVCGFFF